MPGRHSRAPSYEAPLRFAGRYRRAAVAAGAGHRRALSGKQPSRLNVNAQPKAGLLEDTKKIANTISLQLAVRPQPVIVKKEHCQQLRAYRKPFDGSGLLRAVAKTKHVAWRAQRKATAEQLRLAHQQQSQPSTSLEALEELGHSVVVGLKALEQREREVARRVYNRESAKLSSLRRMSYLSELKAESQALHAALSLRQEQFATLQAIVRMAATLHAPPGAAVRQQAPPSVKSEVVEMH